MNLKEKPIFISKDKNFTLYQNDCNKLLPKFEKQFDLIFADPPYFLSNDGLSIQNGKIVSVNKGNWDKGDDIEKIDKFNLKWLSNAK
ncbi:site-specific DNA-methyltransferase, partial [Campylobacter coli]|nr:site-specific DNA-methyltransferase [Campylobacter coli]